jgi:hypothetical protein
MRLTKAMLLEAGVDPACEDFQAVLREWGEEGEVTLESLERADELDLDVHGFVEKVLTAKAFDRYCAQMGPVLSRRNMAELPATRRFQYRVQCGQPKGPLAEQLAIENAPHLRQFRASRRQIIVEILANPENVRHMFRSNLSRTS